MMKDMNIRKEPGRRWIEIDDVIHEFLVEDDAHPRAKEIYSMLEEISKKMNLEDYKLDTKQNWDKQKWYDPCAGVDIAALDAIGENLCQFRFLRF
ncbi:hypothetical protein RIF29_00695 [Crotalaria pallida]|uniref:Uncharacterized protein n=1 Tax=Crotalaria pallida TaxID=3830 RepID=A0AAN9P6Q4_CROPI